MARRFEAVDRRPSGRWRARWYTQGERQSRTFLTERDALAFLTTLKVDRYRGPLAPPQARRPLHEWLEYWLTTVEPTIAPQSLRTYRQGVRDLAPLCGRTLDTLTPVDVQRFVTEYGRTHAPQTTKGTFGILRNALNLAVQQRVIRENPCTGIRLPRPRPVRVSEHAPTDADIRAMFLALLPETTHAVAFWLMCLTGARLGEVYALRVEDVHEDSVTFRRSVQQDGTVKESTKTGDVRTVPIDAELRDALGTLGGSTYVFGRPMDYRAWRRNVWDKAARIARVELKPHDTRRWAATALDAAGVPQAARMAFLGHSSAYVASGYLKRTTASALHAREALEAVFWHRPTPGQSTSRPSDARRTSPGSS